MIGDGWLKCPGHRQGTFRRACILANLTPPLPLPASRLGRRRSAALGQTARSSWHQHDVNATCRADEMLFEQMDGGGVAGCRVPRGDAQAVGNWVFPAFALLVYTTQTRLKLEVSTCDPPSPPELPRPTFRLAEQESCKSRVLAAYGLWRTARRVESSKPPPWDPAGLDYPNFHHSCQRAPDSPCF